MEEGIERLYETEETKHSAVYCETVFPRNVRSDTWNVSPAWLPKHELNKDNISPRVSTDGEKLSSLGFNPT